MPDPKRPPDREPNRRKLRGVEIRETSNRWRHTNFRDQKANDEILLRMLAIFPWLIGH
jgi:hypothetical protein